MIFKLEIECENAAFEDCPAFEVARILRKAASEMVKSSLDPFDMKLRDSNGNTVGRAWVEP